MQWRLSWRGAKMTEIVSGHTSDGTHFISVPMSDNTIHNIDYIRGILEVKLNVTMWCMDNLGYCHHSHCDLDYTVFKFKIAEDAMAFKLAWC